jgi:hypothetical protein
MTAKQKTLESPDGLAGQSLGAASGSEALDKRIRKAVEADFQQWMIDSLTPDRGYMTPIDNVRSLIRELVPPNDELCGASDASASAIGSHPNRKTK